MNHKHRNSPGLVLLAASLLSGILLIGVYDFQHPLLSISDILLTRPFMRTLRNVHFWSPLVFLLWAGFRLVGLRKRTAGYSPWVRVFPGLILFFVFYSGYALSGYMPGPDSGWLRPAMLYLHHAVWGTLSVLIFVWRRRSFTPDWIYTTSLIALLTVVSVWITPLPETIFDKEPSTSLAAKFPWPRMKAGLPMEVDSLALRPVRDYYEGCLSCHDDMIGLSPVHDPSALGCYSCHRGNPFTLEREKAHDGMLNIPGNLNTAALSCGTVTCHPGIAERVKKSPMNLLSGMIAVNRYVFDEAPQPDGTATVHDLSDSPADTHLRQLCVSCHLNRKKTETGPIHELSRGGGCNACHLNYASDRDKTKHPQLNLNVSDGHCFGCHSRSGRISLNYAGWHEMLADSLDITAEERTRRLADGRITRFVQEDVHHKKGLLCIDCHISYELMGDGRVYGHKEQATVVRCADCHTRNPQIKQYEELDREERTIFNSRGMALHGTETLATAHENRALINVIKTDGRLVLIGKKDGTVHVVKPPADVCASGKAHAHLTCTSCHSAWVPQCIGCHTRYNPDAMARDHLSGREMHGQWEELTGVALAEPPPLGVREEGAKAHIIPVTPGMILTIDKGKKRKTVYKRLYAPAEPHTVSAAGRSCVSCHWDARTIGYGRGAFYVDQQERIRFAPEYAAREEDGLPEDAWIGFLESPKENRATRMNLRPFTRPEQQRILRVGGCLRCHKNNRTFEKALLTDFKGQYNRRSAVCRDIRFE